MPLARHAFTVFPTLRPLRFMRRLGELILAILVLGEAYLLLEGLARLIL